MRAVRELRARGKRKWHANLKVNLKPGRYRVTVVAVDKSGNLEKPARRNTRTFRIKKR